MQCSRYLGFLLPNLKQSFFLKGNLNFPGSKVQLLLNTSVFLLVSSAPLDLISHKCAFKHFEIMHNILEQSGAEIWLLTSFTWCMSRLNQTDTFCDFFFSLIFVDKIKRPVVRVNIYIYICIPCINTFPSYAEFSCHFKWFKVLVMFLILEVFYPF